MKKFIILSLALVIGAMSLNSCKKYEEGPGISLRSKTARLTGEWKLSKYFENGVEDTNTSSDSNETSEFTKDGKVIISYTDGVNTESVEGTWEWGDKKESIKITFSYFGFTFTEDYPIVRLTNKEMIWEGPDEDGDVIRTEYEKL